jgi:hypothetical protein
MPIIFTTGLSFISSIITGGIMPKHIKVIPAILTDKPQDLKIMVRQVETFTNYVQIDIMDELLSHL